MDIRLRAGKVFAHTAPPECHRDLDHSSQLARRHCIILFFKRCADPPEDETTVTYTSLFSKQAFHTRIRRRVICPLIRFHCCNQLSGLLPLVLRDRRLRRPSYSWTMEKDATMPLIVVQVNALLPFPLVGAILTYLSDHRGKNEVDFVTPRLSLLSLQKRRSTPLRYVPHKRAPHVLMFSAL